MNSYWVAHASAQARGVKINGTCNCYFVLRQMLLPDICGASGSEFFLFFSRTVPHYIAPKTQ